VKGGRRVVICGLAAEMPAEIGTARDMLVGRPACPGVKKGKKKNRV
jgi:hypothetical protein